MKKKALKLVMAMACAFTFAVPVTASATLYYGDVNGDNALNILDLAALNDYLLDNTKPIILANADIDLDGNVDSADSALLRDALNSNLGGDTNGDYDISIDDVTTLRAYLLDNTAPIVLANADVDEDDSIDVIDLGIIQSAVNSHLKGDVNGNYKVTQEDKALLQSYLLDSTTPIVRYNADLDSDGDVDVIDLGLLTQQLS